VVNAGASESDIANALRQVWASVWLQGAYEEREWYRVDHSRVAMAVLVQPFVDGAVVNGVAITENPFFEGRPGFFVNAQALGGSVTGATGDEIPEQLLIYTYSEDLETEVLTRSSRNNGQALLNDVEVRALADVLSLLHRHLTVQWGGRANACDVEFLVAGDDRHVVIVQARPFNVVWSDAQR
jgi:rifampicin phosphotransferase